MNVKQSPNKSILFFVVSFLLLVVPVGVGVAADDPTPMAEAAEDASGDAHIAGATLNGPVSDDFSCGLNTALWTFVNPLGDGVLDVTNGTQALISVPLGQSHNIWIDGNKAPRLMQTVTNPPEFQVVVKFESTVTQQYQMQGLLAEQGPLDFLRFEFHYGGGTTHVYAATFVNGFHTQRFNIVIPSLGAASYLRMTRAGNQWTLDYSLNGTDWTNAGIFDHTMTVNSLGFYAANHKASGDSPAHTAVVDYFFNTASPIEPEDAGCVTVAQLYLPSVLK
jgi:hypothetical protein